jgi:Uma2 family endonuclease
MASITARYLSEPVEVPLPPDNLRETDEVPLETAWHRDEIGLLIESVVCRLEERTDYYVGGNMFIYFGSKQAGDWSYRGPDFFFVWGVDGSRPRRYWAIWDEGGKYPDLLIELLSPSTAQEDLTTKKDLYERTFHTPEYFCYDPDARRLLGWRLQGTQYQEIAADERGRMWCQTLNLWLGTWEGVYLNRQATWLRFFDAQGQLVPIKAEREHEWAEQEHRQAEHERQRVAALEAEVARLKALLAQPAPPALPPDNPTS